MDNWKRPRHSFLFFFFSILLLRVRIWWKDYLTEYTAAMIQVCSIPLFTLPSLWSASLPGTVRTTSSKPHYQKSLFIYPSYPDFISNQHWLYFTYTRLVYTNQLIALGWRYSPCVAGGWCECSLCCWWVVWVFLVLLVASVSVPCVVGDWYECSMCSWRLV